MKGDSRTTREGWQYLRGRRIAHIRRHAANRWTVRMVGPDGALLPWDERVYHRQSDAAIAAIREADGQ